MMGEEVMERNNTNKANRTWEKEIMDKAVFFSATQCPFSEREKTDYAGKILMMAIENAGEPLDYYTRKDNLRYDMASLRREAIKRELLKNMITVALIDREFELNDNVVKDYSVTNNYSIDEETSLEGNAKHFLNIISNKGAEAGYDMLDDPKALKIACQLYAVYRQPKYKDKLDKIGSNDYLARKEIEKIDEYYRQQFSRKSPKEIMDKAVFFSATQCPLGEREKVDYAGKILMAAIANVGEPFDYYTSKGNLRDDMASLSLDAIKTELLKNITAVALIDNDGRSYYAGNSSIDPEKSIENNARSIFNAMINGGIQAGYDMLDDPKALKIACQLYAVYRQPKYKDKLDEITSKNSFTSYNIDGIDRYYEKQQIARKDTYGNGSVK